MFQNYIDILGFPGTSTEAEIVRALDACISQTKVLLRQAESRLMNARIRYDSFPNDHTYELRKQAALEWTRVAQKLSKLQRLRKELTMND